MSEGKKREGRRRRRPKKRSFSYGLPYHRLNLRDKPELYRVGKGEQGVLLVEPYKGEILPHWRFRSPPLALSSARKIFKLFHLYRKKQDFVGMDMARKFLQMGFTRSRRYANHRSGRKYSQEGKVLPLEENPEKAASAEIFFRYWKRAERDPDYEFLKELWRQMFG